MFILSYSLKSHHYILFHVVVIVSVELENFELYTFALDSVPLLSIHTHEALHAPLGIVFRRERTHIL